MRNSVVTLSFGRLRFRPFWCSGPPWAHVLDFNLAKVRLFQTSDFCEARVFPGGGVSIFFCMRRLARSIYLSTPKISGIFKHPKNILPELTHIYENIRVPPPPPLPPWWVFLHSYTRCPSESDKTGVMKIATNERDIENDVIVYIVIGDAYHSVNKTNHRVDSLNISVISRYLVYPVTYIR